MVEALCSIFSGVWIATVLFFIVRETREKNNKESHESWLFDVRAAIHGIEYEFLMECQNAADSNKNFMGKIIVDKYRKEIYALQKEYTNSLYERIVARMGNYSVKSIPGYLEREYERNISDIAYTFLHFCDVLSDQQ